MKDAHSHAKRDVAVASHSWRQGGIVYECVYFNMSTLKTKWVKDLVKQPVALHLPLSQWWIILGKLEPRNSIACLLWLLKCKIVGKHFGMGGGRCHLKSQWCDSWAF